MKNQKPVKSDAHLIYERWESLRTDVNFYLVNAIKYLTDDQRQTLAVSILARLPNGDPGKKIYKIERFDENGKQYFTEELI